MLANIHEREEKLMISIIITHYKEPWEIVKPMFDSIMNQLGVDFEKDIEIIFVNDGTDFEIPEVYPFTVENIKMEHGGVSKARNKGLSLATGDYVMFCDCDDRFISSYALHLYKKHMGHFDVIKSPFIEDQVIDGELKLIRHEKDISFIHGKLYRKAFLDENNIRFCDDLTIHEDGFFNVIANILAQGNIYEMSPAVYLWKFNDNSVVRRDREMFIYKTYDHLMSCRIAICNNLKEREMIEHYFPAVSKTVIDSYYDFQKPEALDPKNKDLIKFAEKEFARFYKEFREDYNEIGIEDIAQMMFLCRQNAFINNMRIEQETLSQFLTRIVKEYL